MQVHLFGGPCVSRDGNALDLGRPKQRFLFALLAIDSGRVVATDRLLQLLWADHDTTDHRASLHAYVANLRRGLETDRGRGIAPSVLLRQPPGYRLAVPRVAVDVLRFEDLVDAGRRHLSAGDDSAALEMFDASIAAWTGPPLPELDGEPVVIDAVTRWRGLLAIALEGAAHLHLENGAADVAVRLLEPALEDFPLRERLHGLAALALYRTGRQTDALRTLDRARRALADGAGLELTSELRVLEARILAHADDLQWQPPARRTDSPVGRAPAESVAEPVPLEGIPLVGRSVELQTLVTAAARAARGHGGSVAVVGASGVGKTALVERFLTAPRGPGVAWARLPRTGAVPPFWPLAELGRQLRGDGTLDAPLVTDDAGAGPDTFLLAQQAATALRTASRPPILVIDDLQWADADTLRVLVHLLAELRASTALLVVIVRPLAVDAPDELVACLAELARQRLAEVALHELDVPAISDWIRQRIGSAPDGLAADIHDRTGGNALFVRELVELLAAEPTATATAALPARIAAIPPGVQAVIRRRISRLPVATQQLLSVASVVGSTFDVAVVADVAARTAGTAASDLVAALDSSVVVSTDDPAVVRFSHVIVAEALAAEVPPARRAEVHAAAARSLAKRHPDDDHAAVVAHHALAGVPAGTAALAVDAATRAARHATARFAPSEAARAWAMVAAALGAAQPDDAGARLTATLEAARAHERAGQIPEAQAAVIAAIGLARQLGDRAALGEAAAVLNHASIFPNQPYGVVDLELVSILGDALASLVPGDRRERALVLAALGTELFHSADVERRDSATTEALEAARRLGDPTVVARALHARTFALKRASDVAERKAIALEMAAVAEANALGDDLVLVAHLQVALADLALGDVSAARARLPRCLGLGDRPVGHALRSQLLLFRAHLDIVQGRYAEGIPHADESFEHFRRSRPADAVGIRIAQQLMIGHDVGGDVDDLVTGLRAAPAAGGYANALRLLGAVILFDLGRPDDAVRLLPHARGTLLDRPLDYVTTFLDVAAAHAAAETADAAAAVGLLERLSPYAGRWANAGTGAGSLGLVDLAIARLHVTVGDGPAARHWFERAVVGHERTETPAWLARSLVHQGRFLIDAGAAEDGRRALVRAAALADAFALPIVARQVAERT